jgi:hypothetical protein
VEHGKTLAGDGKSPVISLPLLKAVAFFMLSILQCMNHINLLCNCVTLDDHYKTHILKNSAYREGTIKNFNATIGHNLRAKLIMPGGSYLHNALEAEQAVSASEIVNILQQAGTGTSYIIAVKISTQALASELQIINS